MKQMNLLIALIYCVPLHFIYAEDDYKKCYTGAYEIVIYGQFFCNNAPHQPKKVSLIEYSGTWVSKKVIQPQIVPFHNKSKMYYYRKTQETPATDFSVSMEVMHTCNVYRGRPCPHTFIEHIPTSYIDCHGNERVAYRFSINLNSGKYRGNNGCFGPFGK